MLNSADAEDLLATALSAIEAGDGFEAVLDAIPVRSTRPMPTGR
jgi:hypothetical protein